MPGAPKGEVITYCNFAFHLGKNRAAPSVVILEDSLLVLLFRWSPSYGFLLPAASGACCPYAAASGAGFLGPNARACRRAIEPSCRLLAGLPVPGTAWSKRMPLPMCNCGVRRVEKV